MGRGRPPPSTQVVSEFPTPRSYTSRTGQNVARYLDRLHARMAPFVSEFVRRADPDRVDRCYVVTHVGSSYPREEEDLPTKIGCEETTGEPVYSDLFSRDLQPRDDVLNELIDPLVVEGYLPRVRRREMTLITEARPPHQFHVVDRLRVAGDEVVPPQEYVQLRGTERLLGLLIEGDGVQIELGAKIGWNVPTARPVQRLDHWFTPSTFTVEVARTHIGVRGAFSCDLQVAHQHLLVRVQLLPPSFAQLPNRLHVLSDAALRQRDQRDPESRKYRDQRARPKAICGSFQLT